MKSGVFWQVVVAFKKAAPISFMAENRAKAIEAIAKLPKTDGQPLLFKLAFFKGRIYAKRQVKID